jgi:hypothetical protein
MMIVQQTKNSLIVGGDLEDLLHFDLITQLFGHIFLSLRSRPFSFTCIQIPLSVRKVKVFRFM